MGIEQSTIKFVGYGHGRIRWYGTVQHSQYAIDAELVTTNERQSNDDAKLDECTIHAINDGSNASRSPNGGQSYESKPNAGKQSADARANENHDAAIVATNAKSGSVTNDVQSTST